jgi:hypothetical protein
MGEAKRRRGFRGAHLELEYRIRVIPNDEVLKIIRAEKPGFDVKIFEQLVDQRRDHCGLCERSLTDNLGAFVVGIPFVSNRKAFGFFMCCECYQLDKEEIARRINDKLDICEEMGYLDHEPPSIH